jgi:PAS domain S-box-containing protein
MDIKRSMTAERIASLYSWDIFTLYLSDLATKAKLQNELLILEQFQEQFNWKVDLTSVLNKPYDALVLTDSEVKIMWVNGGFTKMTGYPKKEAIGKSPKMLQGKNTLNSSREFIRTSLTHGREFSAEIINYRKTGCEYLCQVEIHPIFDHAHVLRHYLALEKEIR